jgi:hypothetical protein
MVIRYRAYRMRSTFKKYYVFPAYILMALIVSACTVMQPHPDNNPVRLFFYNEINIAESNVTDCRYLGMLVNSQGHWYDYLFISNAELTNGAINDMRNKASKIGADAVYINNNIDFATSVTWVGQAYNCNLNKS